MANAKRAEKLSITLPWELADEIRRLVPQGGVSAFFTEAVRHTLARQHQKVALEQGFGAWSSEKHPELATPEASTSYVRSLRETDRKRLPKRVGR